MQHGRANGDQGDQGDHERRDVRVRKDLLLDIRTI